MKKTNIFGQYRIVQKMELGLKFSVFFFELSFVEIVVIFGRGSYSMYCLSSLFLGSKQKNDLVWTQDVQTPLDYLRSESKTFWVKMNCSTLIRFFGRPKSPKKFKSWKMI